MQFKGNVIKVNFFLSENKEMIDQSIYIVFQYINQKGSKRTYASPSVYLQTLFHYNIVIMQVNDLESEMRM